MGDQSSQNQDNFFLERTLAGERITISRAMMPLMFLSILMAGMKAVAGRDEAELKTELELKRQQVFVEIKKLREAYAVRLPQSMARQIGTIYARYSTKDQNSIADQVRINQESQNAKRFSFYWKMSSSMLPPADAEEIVLACCKWNNAWNRNKSRR